jgi:hypothetical protein
MTPIRLYLLGLLALLAAPLAMAGADPLQTVAEQSGFTRTGRYEEVIRLCNAFAERYPDAVRCIEFGRTPEGRPMQALIVSTSGAMSGAKAQKLPVVLIQGGIHSGEIDGKDAGFLALRQVLDGEAAKGSLDKLVLVFVPVFNIDGHERFKAWNRPNQRGPEQMGWRTTAQNFNLNRDYVKADSAEMQAMLGLINDWKPITLVDLHVTDGAKFEHDISINVEPVYSGDAQMRKAGRSLRSDLVNMLAKQGSLPLAFYPSFVEYDNPQSGFADGVPPPRFSHGYMPLRNRFGVLVETHSWKDYPTRVRATRNTIIDVLELVARDGARWSTLAEAADRRASTLGGTVVPVSYKAGDKSHLIDFRGYAYTRTPSEISGALMTRYDESKPQVWKIPLRDDVQPDLTVQAPAGGYVIPVAEAAWVERKLTLHGIEFRRLHKAIPKAVVEAFRAESAAGASYQAGAADGSRPGIFYINTFNLRAQPLFGMETLSLHEASPGHHFQIAIAQEDAALPAFRRFGGGYVAYSEGWALYAESLGKELGLFTDPYQWYGRLSDEMLRAMRLVVDTGLHAKGWSRERAIRYMRDNSSLAESDVVAEVERYLVMPGQALGYKVGELEIRRLRREAEAALGERFDIKAFHRVVLRAGQVPLDVLGVLVREWVRSRR